MSRSLLTAGLLASLVGCLYLFIRLRRNIQVAKGTGLPYGLSPIHELQVWAYLTDPILRWWYHDNLLAGDGWPRWARFMIKDWHYEDKRRAHEELGDIFLVVSPGGLVCYVGEAAAALNVATRRKAFIKPPEKMKLLELFGPNVVSSEGDLWRLHIRVTLPPFGEEGVQNLVWAETTRQAASLVASWTDNDGKYSGATATNVKADIYLLSLNVMSLAGFGHQSEWKSAENSALPAGHTLSLVESLVGVIAHLPHILLLPLWFLRVLSPWTAAYKSYVEFDRHMNRYIAKEKAQLATGAREVGGNKVRSELARENLLTAVLRENKDGSANEKIATVGNRATLTDREIKGNVFVFFFAGYDTTANTIMFSLNVIAIYSDIQDQVVREIDDIWAQARAEGRSELSYATDFTKFRYLTALMFEVMRVFPTVLPIGRVTTSPQEIVQTAHDGDKKQTTHILPKGTGVIVNNTAVHFSRAHWPSPHVLDPRRWLVERPNAFDPAVPLSAHDDECICNGSASIPGHVRGTFMTFSEGPRACIGRNFAKAEYVAFFARLLRAHRLVLRTGVDAAQAEREIRLRSAGSPVSLMPDGDVPVRIVPR
ncbi:cytochrome P450 [Nemania serpens]|nr:cytochrome P450 [Nemania serpens]